MKLSKKKVFALAVAVCLIATLSLGSLAWFTDQDEVTNEFLVAGSDITDPDDIFSVVVEEESNDPDATETEEGIQYDKILPGDTLSKIVNVTNTGSYNEYIRVKITVSNADLWQEIYAANRIPVTAFVDLDLERTDIYGIGTYFDEDTNSLVYYVYFTEELAPDATMNVFNNAFVAGALTQHQAAEIGGKFSIKVVAEAVQTENVGENVYEAFETVGMLNETNAVNTAWVNDKAELINAFQNDNAFIILEEDITDMYAANKLIGTKAEIYLNGKTVETAYGTFDGTNYGVVATEKLTIGGVGTFGVGSLKLKTAELDVRGGTIVNDDRIVIE